MEELKNYFKGFLDTALDKFKGLTDSKEIGKCIRALFIAGASAFSFCTLIKNGGIKYGKLSIGNVQNQALLENK